MSNDFEEMKKQTIDALNNSMGEFDKLKECFITASDAFDDGNDLDGLQIVQDNVHPGVASLCQFVASIFSAYNEYFNEDVKEKLIKKIEEIENLVKDLAEETTSGNFTEIGDILRFDFTDIVDDLAELFPEMAKEILNITEEE